MENNARQEKPMGPAPNASRWLGHLLPLALAILVLAGGAHALDLWGWVLPDAIPFIGNGFGSTAMTQADYVPPDTSWMPLSLVALAFGVALAALAQTSGGLLGMKVSAWGKERLKTVAKSAIIVCFIFLGFLATTAAPGSFYYIGPIQIDRALAFAQTVRSTLVMEFLSMTTLTAVLSLVGNITPYFRPAGIIGISFSLAPAFRPLFDGLGIMLSMMSVAVGEWFVNTWILSFTKARLLSVFLPTGLFLRAFGLERAGDVLIAIAIGFFFVYPFMLNVNAYAMDRYLQSEFGTGPYQDMSGNAYGDFESCIGAHPAQGAGAGACFFRLQFIGPMGYMLSVLQNNWGASLGLGALVQWMTGSVVATAFGSFLIFFLLAILKATVFYVVLVSVLMPLFNLFITLTVIKELAGFLGTNIDLSAFERIF